MLKSNTKWQMKEVDEQQADRLAKSLDVSPIIGKLLVGRGIDQIEQAALFLHSEQNVFHDPMLLDGMEKAVDRIHHAVNHNEKILIFGDYDADGVSSTSLMVRALKGIGADVSFYVPNRFREGYGPNKPALKQAKDNGNVLVITVDTGISACEEATFAKEIGLDYIVTDHHEPPPVLPEAYCIINPKKPGCGYPFKSLAGVGVAFKLVHALLGDVPQELLSLAAIGTISDLVPLVDENRLIASKGLAEINRGTFAGIDALISICGIDDHTVDSDHIGFGIGPRLNAAGRMADADVAIDLLLTDDTVQAKEMAHTLDELNKERKAIVDNITQEALIKAQGLAEQNQSVYVISGEDWHAGVIGISASRIVEKFYRPTIILTIDPETGLAKGSARSIDGFDIFEALSSCRDILPHFGGHPMAAGMTLKSVDLPELQERLNHFAKGLLTDDMLIPVTTVDVECQVEDITLDLIETLAHLAPFGMANPKPRFAISNTALSQIKQIGREKDHLKIVFDGNKTKLDGIAFRMGDKFDHMTPGAQLSAVGELNINEWNGFRKPQIMIHDLKINEWQLFDWRHEQQKLFDRILKLPSEKRIIVAFRPDSIAQLGLKEIADEVLIAGNNPISTLADRYLILLDLPDEQRQMEELFWENSYPERIYTVFHHSEENYFTSFPARDHFKWLFALITQQQPLQLSSVIGKIAKYKGWRPDTIKFMTEVFFELDFVKIENGLITVNQTSEKRPLETSLTYQKKQEQMHLEDILCYSSYQSLKTWFNKERVDRNSVKEAAYIEL